MANLIPITLINLYDIDTVIYIIKMFLMGLCTYYTFTHVLNLNSSFNLKSINVIPITFIIAFIHTILKSDYHPTSIIFFILSLSILHSFITSNRVGYSILVTLFSFSLNYLIYFVAIVIEFVPYKIIGIQNDIYNLILIYAIHIILLSSLFKIRRFNKRFWIFSKEFKQ